MYWWKEYQRHSEVYKTGLTIGEATTELGLMIIMGMLGLQNNREYIVVFLKWG